MTWNFNMDAAPKDQPILAWCQHEWPHDQESQNRLSLYEAHAEGLSHAEDGPHVIEWGGAWQDCEEDGGGGLPDWWFRWDSEWEVAANPIAWQLIQPLKTKQIHLLAFDDTDRAECSGDDNEPCTSSFALVTCVDCKSALDDRGLLPDPPAVPHMPWLTDDDAP